MTQNNAQSPPLHFWILSILGVAYFVMGCVRFAQMQLQSPSLLAILEPHEIAFLQSYTASEFTVLWLLALCGLVGCLLMLLRRSVATIGLIGSVVFALVHEFQIIFLMDPPPVPLIEKILAPVMLIGIPVLLWWYANAMKRRGVLR